MNILALDVAMSTGYAIYSEGRIVKSGTWHLKKKRVDLEKNVEAIIDEFQIDKIIVEDFFRDKTKNPQTANSLASQRGVVDLIAERRGLPELIAFPPTLIKRTVAGYERAGKTAMINSVKMLGYKLEHNEADDEADAIAIVITYTKNRGYPLQHPK